MKSLIMIASACLLGAGSLLAVDTQPPAIASISVAPGSVDVTSSPQTVTVTLQITDDESGFSAGNLYLYNAADHYVEAYSFDATQRTSGTPQSGSYSVSVPVPGFGSPGTWRFEAYVRDGDFNSRNYDASSGGQPFPIPADASFTVTNSGTPDTTGPAFTNIVFSPLSVNTGTGPANVSVTFDAADTPSGYDYGYIYIQDPNGDYQYANFQQIDASNRLSGNEFSGSYQASTTIAQGSLTGTWKVQLGVRDKLGNYSFSPLVAIEVTGAAASLANAVDAVQYVWLTSNPGFASQAAVTHDGVDAAASPPLGDNSEATMETTVTGPGTLSFWWKVDSEEFADLLAVEVPDTSTRQEISGNVDWQKVTLNIPGGTHTVVWSYTKDSSAFSGADRGWVDQVRFLAASDADSPVLQSVRITPNFINVSQSSKSVTVTIEASDDANGILKGYVDLVTTSGSSVDTYYFSSADRIDGDANYGTYEVSFQIDNSNGYGIWSVEIQLEEDVSGATVYYGPDDTSFPNPGEQFLTVADADEPGDAPLVEEFALSPAAVDVTSAAQNVIATLRITDATGGFANGEMFLAGPSGQAIVFPFDSAQRTSGDEYDGMYDVTITLPLYAQPGDWSLNVAVQDFDNNRRSYPNDPPHSLPGGNTITVTNTGAIDASSPVVTSFQVSSNQVDATAAPVTVTVTLTVTDSPAGLKEGQFFLYNASGGFFSGVPLTFINRTGGDTFSGDYQFDFTIPMGAAPGVWTVRSFLRDNAGNTGNYGFPFSPAFPGPGSASITVGAGAVSTYQTFVAAYSLTGPSALANADPDNDGIPNAVELLLGSDPTVAGASGLVVSRAAGFVYLDFTVAAPLAVTASGDFLEIRNSGGGDPLRVTGQTQSGLGGTWTNGLPVLQSGKTYRVALPIGPGGAGFARLYFQ